MLKITDSGARIQGLPARETMTHEDAPGAVVEAVAEHDEALAAMRETGKALHAAEKAAGERIPRLKGQRDLWEAQIREATREEHEANRKARTACNRAAQALVTALQDEDNRRTLVAIAARARLRRYVAACNALPAITAFLGCGSGTMSRSGTDLAGWVDPVTAARPDVASVRDALVQSDVPGLLTKADRTAAEYGLVAVRNQYGRKVLTTEALAKTLVAGSGGWSHAEDEEAKA